MNHPSAVVADPDLADLHLANPNLANLRRRLRTRSWFLGFFVIFLAPAWLFPIESQAQGFPPISPDELSMTSEPKAPGAPAIILYREVDYDENDKLPHENRFLRIKILNEAGRKYGDVEIPFPKTQEIRDLHARTIHPDGSVIEFKGEVFEKTIVKTRGLKYLAKTFTLPDVQPGSIVEYSYTMDFRQGRLMNSSWIVSSDLFTRKVKFTLKPYMATSRTPISLRWTWHRISSSYAPIEGPGHVYHMELEDIPAVEEEDHMPPMNEMRARVDFVYDSRYRENDPDAYWQHVGRVESAALETFLDKRKAMEQAVAQIISPDDDPEVKLRKIYTRVQQLRNKSFEESKTLQEEKRDKDKIDENVEDVWRRGYGSHLQLTWLYLALARAAGFEAYGVLASDRRDQFFTPKTMEYWKLNAGVVLVKLKGKDLFLDPGSEFNPFGMLTWYETGVTGLRLDANGGTWIKVPASDCSQSLVEHTAKLKLTPDGTLEGKVTLNYTGLEAMYHRLDMNHEDDGARKKFLEERIRSQIPGPAEVELIRDPDWMNPDSPFTAEFTVKIPNWTSNAGKRTLIPASLFNAGEKHLFEHTNRISPIYFFYPYEKLDDVTIELPEGWEVRGLPSPQVRDGHVVTYSLQAENNKTVLHLTRKLTVNFILLEAIYYPSLREFYQSVRSGDDQQIVLEPRAVAAN
jgi:Domain of Unknown Function with PDB structure (DUF3857)